MRKKKTFKLEVRGLFILWYILIFLTFAISTLFVSTEFVSTIRGLLDTIITLIVITATFLLRLRSGLFRPLSLAKVNLKKYYQGLILIWLGLLTSIILYLFFRKKVIITIGTLSVVILYTYLSIFSVSKTHKVPWRVDQETRELSKKEHSR